MGIPSYFSHIIKKYGSIIKILTSKNIHNLYFDSNSIIYDIIRLINYADYSTNKEYEEKIYLEVCKKLEEYINIVQPQTNVYIAFDGVAPVAKLKQQKTRRYKSKFIKYIETYIKKETDTEGDKNADNKPIWDQAAITPGTNFMNQLTPFIINYFKHTFINTNNINFIVSGADEVGEGEHKIFEFIRKNNTYHDKTSTFIYGLDSDLIMLCLNHLSVSKNLYLFRESPDFANSINSSIESNVLCYLDINLLSDAILTELCSNPTDKNKKYKLYDYILISFLLGNDFLPHFPALNIRTNGIQYVLNTYKSTIKNKSIYM